MSVASSINLRASSTTARVVLMRSSDTSAAFVPPLSRTSALACRSS